MVTQARFSRHVQARSVGLLMPRPGVSDPEVSTQQASTQQVRTSDSDSHASSDCASDLSFLRTREGANALTGGCPSVTV